MEGARPGSRTFPTRYRRAAEKSGCGLLDASGVVVSSDLDGVRLERTGHARLGAAITARAREIFG